MDVVGLDGKRLLIMKAAMLIALCCFLAGCSNSNRNYELNPQSFTPQDLRMVEQKIGISFPDGSRGLNMYNAQAEIDPSFMAKIEIPTASREGVTAELERIPSETLSVTNYLIQRVTWWHPTAATTRIERRFFRPKSGDFVEILLCEEDGHAILYIDWASR